VTREDAVRTLGFICALISSALILNLAAIAAHVNWSLLP
jgi:hypothetical protein